MRVLPTTNLNQNAGTFKGQSVLRKGKSLITDAKFDSEILSKISKLTSDDIISKTTRESGGDRVKILSLINDQVIKFTDRGIEVINNGKSKLTVLAKKFKTWSLQDKGFKGFGEAKEVLQNLFVNAA